MCCNDMPFAISCAEIQTRARGIRKMQQNTPAKPSSALMQDKMNFYQGFQKLPALNVRSSSNFHERELCSLRGVASISLS